jgi:hypothetical protein
MSLRRRARPMIVVTAVAALGAIVASVGSPAAPAAEESEPRTCCVANPRYAGICAVDLAPDETCQDVLDYLNNAASVGKTYCGGTNVRMGWKQVECQDEEG